MLIDGIRRDLPLEMLPRLREGSTSRELCHNQPHGCWYLLLPIFTSFFNSQSANLLPNY